MNLNFSTWSPVKQRWASFICGFVIGIVAVALFKHL